MANQSIITGFSPVRARANGVWEGGANPYFASAGDGTPMAIGDAVKMAGDGNSEGDLPTIVKANAGEAIVGIIVGFEKEPVATISATPYRAGNVARTVLVADDPNTLFEVQGDGTYSPSMNGQTCNHSVGTLNTIYGRSGAQLDLSTAGASATSTFRIERKAPRSASNEVGANAKLWVTINNHQLKAGTAGV